VRTEYRGDLWTCDGCGRQTIASDSESPTGYTGATSDGYGHVWEWYACRKNCVSRAIWMAGDRQPQGGD